MVGAIENVISLSDRAYQVLLGTTIWTFEHVPRRIAARIT